MELTLTGKIISVLPGRSGVSARTNNPWMVQPYVIETPGQYPRKCAFEVFGEDKIRQFNIQQGEELTVKIDIDAHEYQGRWFNSIRAYDVVRQQQATQQPAQQATVPAASAAPAGPQQPNLFASQPAADSSGNGDDLPF